MWCPKPTDSSVSLPKIVINTRPIARAAPLTQHLQAAGLIVVEMPMLALQARPITDKDMTLMHRWLAGAYKALVVISPTAAESGLAVWQALEHDTQLSIEERVELAHVLLQPPSHLIAVGTATAAVLSQANINTKNHQICQPKMANNEGMLAMPEIESLQAHDRLLIWRGLGGRRLLVDRLEARGVQVDSIAWYERSMPSDAATQYQQWKQQFLAHYVISDTAPLQRSKPIVVVSSGAAFEHWANVVRAGQPKTVEQASGTSLATDGQHNMPLALSDFSYVVLGERLVNMVAAQELDHWRVEDLEPDTILSTIHSNA